MRDVGWTYLVVGLAALWGSKLVFVVSPAAAIGVAAAGIVVECIGIWVILRG